VHHAGSYYGYAYAHILCVHMFVSVCVSLLLCYYDGVTGLPKVVSDLKQAVETLGRWMPLPLRSAAAKHDKPTGAY